MRSNWALPPVAFEMILVTSRLTQSWLSQSGEESKTANTSTIGVEHATRIHRNHLFRVMRVRARRPRLSSRPAPV